MKKFLVLLAALISTLQIFAQPSAGNAPGGGARFTATNNGHLFGKTVDSTGKAVSEASVIVLQSKFDTASKKSKDVLIKGTSTASNGDFSIEDLPMMGRLKVVISSTGFKELKQDFSFMPPRDPKGTAGGAPPPMIAGGSMMGSPEKDLGKIKLRSEIKQLQDVTVTTTKSLMRLDIDKKVFNVDKNIVSDGGTAVDVMKNVPSVNVDIDGGVTVRNSAPQIFVDGRPTSLTLEQIPANAIESVEVMTNPSAKYDASGGGAGILNIVLKKNKKTGYNGNIRTGINKYGERDAGVDFNVRQGKINFNAGINARVQNGRSSGTTERTNLTTLPVTTIDQVNTDRSKGNMLFGRAGLDYFITNKTTLSLSGVKIHGDIKPASILNITTDSLFNASIISSFSQRNTASERVFNAQGLVFGMKHLFAKAGEEWTADANFFSGKNNNYSLYTTDYYLQGKGSDIRNTMMQQIISGGSDKNIVLQSDYVKPITSNVKLETGVRAAMRSRINTNNNYTYDYTTNTFVIVPNAASNYKSSDNVYAAYASIAGSVKDFGYKIGLRAESSNYAGELTDTKQTFSNKYPISLFPSIFLSQKLGNNQELQVSYTKRINRPNFFQLIPFTDSTDKLNITMGNPNLLPEFTQSLEMNYLKQFKGNNTFLASVYYKKTNNLMTSYLSQQTNPVTGNTALVNTFINANSSYKTGAEFTLQNNITKWWNTSTDINIYNSKINTSNVSNISQDAITSWFGKFNSSFKLPSNYSIQLSAMYQSKTNLPVNNNQGGPGGGQGGGPGGGGPPGMMAQSSSQGYINPFYGVDLAVKKTLLKNKISVTLSVNDIFKSRKQNQVSYSNYFTQEYNRIRDPQMIRLNLAYSFGKIDALLFKRKSQGTGQTGTESMQ
ncbi:MAG: TonB-dependent receptor [Bacteroidota bacterium]|nr:TonB-dependent receptor [Bacteroidota bacterium]